MSSKAVACTLLATLALAAILLFNYWAAYQSLSTLVYSGIVLALIGLANLAFPFKFLGIRKRASGALVLASGMGLTLAALSWPASTLRVAQPRMVLDDLMPEYQFYERHAVRIHAPREQVMQSIRQSTFRDMTSLGTLLKIRAKALRIPDAGDSLQDKRVLDGFAESGFLAGGSDHEVGMFGIGNSPAVHRPAVRTLQEFAAYREPGAVKMAFNFYVEDAGSGWSIVIAETRVLALDDLTRRGMSRYWRLIVPGSGLLRRQWLDNIRRRAESMPNAQS